MSSISKLQIRGIRSYSPQQDATIEFYSPLTMIVGQNGCGKTTIIESLKYSCTGSLPPNAKSGQSLVNDPGMTDNNEVKASIKLLFHNRSNKVCVAVRSLQVSKKKTKLEFKALEGVFKTKDLDGTTASTSMKCSDMDRILPESLGVSPAILENVIFVHQEDSSWPMQEGKVLKTRFDDIFESTRYTKALEALMKTKKEMQSRAKTLNAERMELAAHLHSAEQSKKEMADAQGSQERIEEELTTIGNLLERTDMKIKQIDNVIQAAQNNVRELQKLEWQVNQAEQRVQDKTSSLEKKMDESDEELQRILNNFELAVAQKQSELAKLQTKSGAAQREIETIRQEVIRLNQKKGQADSLQDQCEQQRQAQMKLLTTLSQKLQVLAHLNTTTWNANTVTDALNRLKAEYNRINEERQGEVRRLDADVKELSSVVQNKKNEVQKLEIELKLKNDEAHGLQQECNTKRLELSRIATSRGNQQNCQDEYDMALRQHEEFAESYNAKATDFKRQLKESSDRIRDLQEEIANDNQLLQELGHHRHEMAAMEANLKQIDSELSTILTDIATIFATNIDNLRAVPQPTMPLQLGEILPQLEGKATQHKVQVDRIRSDLNTAMTERATKEAILAQKKQAQRVLRDKTNAINDLEREREALIERYNMLIVGQVLENSDESVHQLAGDATTDMILDAARAAEAEARDLRTIFKASKSFMKKLAKEQKLRPDNCPCCQQHMNAGVKETYKSTVDRLFSFTEEANHLTDADYKQALQDTAAFVHDAEVLKRRMEPLADARIELERLDHETKELSHEITDRHTRLKQLEARLQAAENESQGSTRLHRDLQDLHIRWRNIEARKHEFLDRKRRQTDSIFTADLNNRSIEDVERGLRDKQEEKDRLQTRKDKLTNEEALLTKRSFALRNNLTEKEKALSDARLEGSRAEELQIAVDTLTQKLAAIDSRKTTLIRDKEQIERELAESNTQLNTRRQELDQRNDHFNRRLQSIDQHRDSLAKMNEALEGFEARYKDMNLGEVARRLEEAERVIHTRQDEIRQNGPSIKKLETELDTQEQTKRNVLGNIELRAKTQELKHLREEYQAMEKQQGASSRQFRDSKQELAEAQRQREELQSQRDTLRGRMAVHRQQVIALQAKLNDPTYRGVEERSRRKNIEYETTNMAASDIDIYHNTLDRAVQQFHSLKIREINKSIHTLWQQIYRGQDIDTIELESGHDIGDGTEERAPATSRSYNYRVVMKKGDLPLDMRGRCSAGQKVLAAIVIRLALAETFCVNCGILALDEPTTNLDDQNKEGLAEALALLIASRSHQQNFQLICITHDLDFVRAIQKQLSLSSEESMPSHYFRVYRQEEGASGKHFSHIEKIPWEDM